MKGPTRIPPGWPSEEALHISFEMTLEEELGDRFMAECLRRGCTAAVLAADIIEHTIRADLFAAVIDG